MNVTLRLDSRKLAYFRFVVLVFAWLLGVLLGCLVYFTSSNVFSSLMRRAVCSPVSIVGLLSVFILPVIAAVLVAVNFDPCVFCFACFLKAFLFTIATFGCYGAFQRGGWLAQLAILFADNCSAVMLACMAFACYYRRKKLTMAHVMNSSAIMAVILTASYFLLHP